MFIRSFTLTRKKAVLCILILGLLLSLAILFAADTAHTDEDSDSFPLFSMATEEQRRLCLQQLGWRAEGNALETLDLVLPDPLSREYLQYNSLQLQQGLDLRPYAGRQVCRYTYALSNHPEGLQGVQANLYVCDDRLIAGDIFCAGPRGFSAPLRYPDAPETKESAGSDAADSCYALF